MVMIRELRIVMPMSLEEYEVGMIYTIMKMEQENLTSREGVEVLENLCFEDDLLGNGQYTSKIYHLQSKLPTWLKTFAPKSSLKIQEESWNAYPKSKTVIKSSCFNQCLLTVETINKPDNGCSENVFGLSDELIAVRKVEVIDINSVEKDYWSKIIGTKKIDLSAFKSKQTGRGPLLKGWQDTCKPVMTAYKLVSVDAPIWGFGNRLEETIQAAQRALLLESHRLCFMQIDKWFGMTMHQISDTEKDYDLQA
ncbi:Phosphatidylinositol transfer protein, partial [Dioscorea alata]